MELPIHQPSDVITAKNEQNSKIRRIAERNTVDQLLERISEQHGKVQKHAARTLAAMIATGEYLEALARKTFHGDLMERVEAIGIRRSTAANYRALASYAGLLRREPGGFEGMSLRGALEHIAIYKAAEADTTEEEFAKGKKLPAATKAKAERIVTGRKLQKAAERFVELVRTHRYEPEVEEVIDDVVTRLKRIAAQSRTTIEAEAEGETDAD